MSRLTHCSWNALRFSLGLWVAAYLFSGLIWADAGQPEASVQKSAPIQEPVTHVISASTKISMIQLDARILEFSKRIEVVDGFNSEILTVSAESPTRIRLHAETTGVTALTVRDETGTTFHIEVFVEADVRELKAYLERLFPTAALEVVSLKESVVLRGWVTEPDIIPQIVAVAKQMYPTVHNQMRVGGISQVQLRVKIMEVQRSKLKEFGFNFLASGKNYAVGSSVGGLSPIASLTSLVGVPPTISPSSTATASVPLNFAITGNTDRFQGFLDALITEALAKTLAEPVLTTTSGRPANLLSGGEFPILVPSGLGTVSIQFREFGVRLEAIPTVLGNGRLRLDISPEVSQRDFSSAVNVNGFVVPGINTRRVNTQVELNMGETVMIGGLILRRRTVNSAKLPIIGELPVIGAGFSKKTNEISETELLIMVTPEFSAAMRPDQVPPHAIGWDKEDPTSKELFVDGMLEVPHYGEPCESCEDGYGTGIVPQGSENCPPEQMMHQQIPANPSPVQAAPELPPPSVPGAAAGEIQTMSGRDEGESRVVPAGGDPFRVPTRKELPVRKSTVTRDLKQAEAPLPGAIRPRSANSRPVGRSSSMNAPQPGQVRELAP